MKPRRAPTKSPRRCLPVETSSAKGSPLLEHGSKEVLFFRSRRSLWRSEASSSKLSHCDVLDSYPKDRAIAGRDLVYGLGADRPCLSTNPARVCCLCRRVTSGPFRRNWMTFLDHAFRSAHLQIFIFARDPNQKSNARGHPIQIAIEEPVGRW